MLRLTYTARILVIACAFICACKTKKLSSASPEEKVIEVRSERCVLRYDPGPCRGAFTRYYFHRGEGKCKSFIYGGCDGVVPFETLEECQRACGGG